MSEYTSSDELSKLKDISSIYHSEELGGVNEAYHVYLRDALIPADGGVCALEVGCGKGLWTSKLAELYARLDIVDGSPDLLSRVYHENKHKTDISVHCALIEDFFANTKRVWEHIYMTFLLEHVEDPVSVIRMAYDHLEPGGILFIAVPNASSVHRVLALRAGLIQCMDELSSYDKLVGHRRVYSGDLLRDHLSQGGFCRIQMKAVGLKPLTLKQLGDLPSPVIDALCASADLAPENSAYLTMRAHKL